jgi:hypothetical protein
VRRRIPGIITGPLVAIAIAAGIAVAADPAKAADAGVFVPSTASGDGINTGPQVLVSRRNFGRGAKLVTATAQATAIGKSSAMLDLRLDCGPESNRATTNVLNWKGSVTVRRVVHDATDCQISVVSAGGYQPADGLRVTVTATARAVVWAQEAVSSSPTGVLVEVGSRASVAPLRRDAGTSSYMNVMGDVKVTTCTSPVGSREEVGLPQMCDGHVNPAGSDLRLSLWAMQAKAGGGYCNSRILSSTMAHVSRYVHHATLLQSGTYKLSRASGCTRTVHVKAVADALAGSDLVVHTGGTLITVWR